MTMGEAGSEEVDPFKIFEWGIVMDRRHAENIWLATFGARNPLHADLHFAIYVALDTQAGSNEIDLDRWEAMGLHHYYAAAAGEVIRGQTSSPQYLNWAHKMQGVVRSLLSSEDSPE
jgi:hypothetical protein